MGNLHSYLICSSSQAFLSDDEIETIKKFAEQGNKYAQFDLGMLYFNRVIQEDTDSTCSDTPEDEGPWHDVDLHNNSILLLGPKNTGIYWLCQAARQWVPRAMHVLAYFAYSHYKFHERT